MPEIRRNSVCYHCHNKILPNTPSVIIFVPTMDGRTAKKILCAACESEYRQCNRCGAYFHKSRVVIYERQAFCFECCNNIFYLCENCGWLIKKTAFSNARFINGAFYCGECFESCFFECERCGGIYPLPSNDGYCGNCARGRNPRRIHRHGYRPKPIQFLAASDHDKSVLYFGVELEVESANESNDDCYEAAAKMPDFVYCQEDGSLHCGFEITTRPFTWQWFKEHKAEIENQVLIIRRQGFRSYNTETCGMHVHLSSAAFSSFHLCRFLTFFYLNPDNQKFILDVSQRKKEHLRHWASIYNEDKGGIFYKVKYKGQPRDDVERYTAVNTRNKNTYEIRIFRGTLKPAAFFKNIEFCKALYEFTKKSSEPVDKELQEFLEHGHPALLNESLKSLAVLEFLRYVQQNSIEYPNLAEFLRKLYKCVLPS
jgi:hypothetical protein